MSTTLAVACRCYPGMRSRNAIDRPSNTLPYPPLPCIMLGLLCAALLAGCSAPTAQFTYVDLRATAAVTGCWPGNHPTPNPVTVTPAGSTATPTGTTAPGAPTPTVAPSLPPLATTTPYPRYPGAGRADARALSHGASNSRALPNAPTDYRERWQSAGHDAGDAVPPPCRCCRASESGLGSRRVGLAG